MEDVLVTIMGINFYTVEEAAKMLGVTKRTLYNWKHLEDGQAPKRAPILNPVTAPNGRKFFREEEVLAAVSHCWGIDISSDTPQAAIESAKA